MEEKTPKCAGPSGWREVRLLRQSLLKFGWGRVKTVSQQQTCLLAKCKGHFSLFHV